MPQLVKFDYAYSVAVSVSVTIAIAVTTVVISVTSLLMDLKGQGSAWCPLR